MSVVGVHIHFHDGELAKFAAYLVDGSIAAMQCVSSKVTSKGSYEKYERIYQQAVKNMALMKKYLTPEQKALIKMSLFRVMTRQANLNDENVSLSKKARLKEYKRAVEKFDTLVKRTSTAIIGDLGVNGGDADAYRMALACTSADIDAVRMMNEIMGLFNSVDDSGGIVNPPNAPQPASKTPQPSKDPKRGKDQKDTKHGKEPKPSTGKHRPRKGKQQAVVDPVPVLTAAMANRLMEMKLS